MTTSEMIEVMQAYERGEQIEGKELGSETWLDSNQPFWDWGNFEYRIKPQPAYRPYKNADEFLAAQREHGMYICSCNTYELPIRVYDMYIYTTILGRSDDYRAYSLNYETLYSDYKWQDGTPCGVKEE